MTFDPLADLLANTGESSDWDFGVVTAVSGVSTATVNIGGVENDFPVGYAAQVGDSVVVLRRGKFRVAVAGISRPQPTTGTVTAVGSNTVFVTINGVTNFELHYPASYTSPTIGDSVWVLGGAVIGKWGAAPTVPPAPVVPTPPPATQPQTGWNVFTAIDAGTYRNGSWRTDTSDVLQGSTGTGSNSGAWFYGTAPQNALSGATILNGWVWLNRMAGSGVYAPQSVHVYKHTSATRPGGDVTRTAGPTDFGLAVAEGGWYSNSTITAWCQNIVDGTARGLGITGDPYLRLTGLGNDGQTGALRMDWQR